MCGIAGIVRPVTSPQALERQLDSMWPGIASRGPDGRGQYVAPSVGLLHSRLAIIDLSTGDQPIWNERRTVGCVFNGEIYNYRTLRENLLARGHTMSTTSDTEVLVHLYEDYGDDLVSHLHGMYAFAIYDAEKQRVFVARDRRGIKPLYLANLPGNGIAFASSIASLLALDVSRAPHPGALAEYFQFGKVGEPRTAYRDVRTLLPAHRLSIDVGSGRITESVFHTLARPRNKASVSGCEPRARAAFEAAVASHMIADVEIGAFLSGGIDSSLVVAQAQRLTSRPLRTFSVGFVAGGAYNESAFAEKVARRIGTNHETIELDSPPSELLRRALAATHQPFAVASFLPLLLLSERAAKDVKVVLTGDGGDEVGFGYGWYRWAKWARRAKLPVRSALVAHMLRRAELASARHRWMPARRGLKFTRGAVLGGPRASNAWRYELTREDAISLLTKEHRQSAANEMDLSPMERAWDECLPDNEALRMADLHVLLRDEMLPKLDRAGMAHGLEGRVPLLDDEFVDAMIDVPADVHLRDPRGKALLRAWSAELCPDIDIERPKHGFDVPIADWLRASLYPDVRRLLLERSSPGLVDQTAARRAWDQMRLGVPGAAHNVFGLLLAELWYEGIAS